ncbi:Glutamyl-tRNA Synthetase, chloroplast precursor [Pavlovales sp. CCMP2436]|nr:Glutamyl-tRNA Synthetase, chloroplast precursor [Pavlovales sp. CCMP2436]
MLRRAAVVSSAPLRSALTAALPARRLALSPRQAAALVAAGPVSDGGPRVRFAPSPTGTLHVGGARTALFNWLLARQQDGKFIVRVEDTDTARSTRASEDSMLADLKWLGLDADEGPHAGGECGPYRQSERGELYTKLATQLIASGAAYPCFCTEEELEAKRQLAEAKGEDPKYDGTWRGADPVLVASKIAAGETYTVRFKVPPATFFEIDDVVRGRVGWDVGATVGDFILLRSTGVPVYNFCVAVDDALMGVTTVVRAEEHLTNTVRQGLILQALGYALPRYAHLSLVLGEDRSKLSKRHGATSVDQFRREGFLPVGMINYLTTLGWNDGTDKEIFTVEELVDLFSLERITKSPAVFDMTKLRWVNAQHIRIMPRPELAALLRGYLVQESLVVDDGSAAARAFFLQVAELAAERVEVVNDIAQVVEQVLSYELASTVVSADASAVVSDGFGEVAAAVTASYEAGQMPTGVEEDFAGAWKAWTKVIGDATGRKGKKLFMPIRLALTGSLAGPDVGATVQLVLLADGRASKVVTMAERMAQLKAVKLPASA